MITVAVIGILAALAVPSFQGYIAHSRMKHQADFLVGVITRARIKAMQETTWRVIFLPAERSFLAYCDRNGNAQMDAGEEMQGPYRLEKTITFGSLAARGPNDSAIPEDGVSFQNNRIVFNRMGSCNAGTVYLKSKTDAAAIRVMPASGTVYLWLYQNGWVSR